MSNSFAILSYSHGWLAGADGAGGADDADDAGGANGDEVGLGLAGDGGASDIDFLYDSICWFCMMSGLLSQPRLRASGFFPSAGAKIDRCDELPMNVVAFRAFLFANFREETLHDVL